MNGPTKTPDPATPLPKGEYEFHPLANIFPPMTEAELKVLSDDIGRNRQQEPITLYQGLILDGRNRYLACKKAYVEPKTVELPSGVDPLAFVISANLHRRHLNETQRGMIAYRLANMRRGGREANPSKEGIDQAKAAEMLNVSVSTVERAAKLAKANMPDLVTAAEQGKVKVSTAIKFAEKKPEERQALLSANENDLVKAVETLKGIKKKANGDGNNNDDYDAIEKQLLESLTAMNPETAEAAAQKTINALAENVKVKKSGKHGLKIVA